MVNIIRYILLTCVNLLIADAANVRGFQLILPNNVGVSNMEHRKIGVIPPPGRANIRSIQAQLQHVNGNVAFIPFLQKEQGNTMWVVDSRPTLSREDGVWVYKPKLPEFSAAGRWTMKMLNVTYHDGKKEDFSVNMDWTITSSKPCSIFLEIQHPKGNPSKRFELRVASDQNNTKHVLATIKDPAGSNKDLKLVFVPGSKKDKSGLADFVYSSPDPYFRTAGTWTIKKLTIVHGGKNDEVLETVPVTGCSQSQITWKISAADASCKTILSLLPQEKYRSLNMLVSSAEMLNVINASVTLKRSSASASNTFNMTHTTKTRSTWELIAFNSLLMEDARWSIHNLVFANATHKSIVTKQDLVAENCPTEWAPTIRSRSEIDDIVIELSGSGKAIGNGMICSLVSFFVVFATIF